MPLHRFFDVSTFKARGKRQFRIKRKQVKVVAVHADGRTGSRPTLNITVVDAGAGLCRKLLNTFGQTFGVCRQINDEPVKPQVLRGLGVGSVRIIGNENQTLGARRNVFKDELGREVFGFL